MKVATQMRLYKRCTNAICKAKTLASPVTAVAASNAVIQVPILAPMVKGKTCLVVNTPAPARGTIRLVVVDDDWTNMVTIVPEAIPFAGLLPTADSIRLFALPVMA